MEVRHSSPRSLGVTSLVYVGDAPEPSVSKATIGLGVAGALLALFAKKKTTRMIGAAAVGVAWYESRR